MPPVGLLIIGRVVAGMPILGAEKLDRRPEIHRLCEERSNLFVLHLQGDSMADPQIDAGDDGIVRAQLWVEHRDVGGINEEVTANTSLHRRTGVWLKPEAQQRGSPPIQLRSQQCVHNMSKVIGMAMWLELQKRLGQLPARHVRLRRPLMGEWTLGPRGTNLRER